jgi:hypothetical protein
MSCWCEKRSKSERKGAQYIYSKEIFHFLQNRIKITQRGRLFWYFFFLFGNHPHPEPVSPAIFEYKFKNHKNVKSPHIHIWHLCATPRRVCSCFFPSSQLCIPSFFFVPYWLCCLSKDITGCYQY